MFSFHGSNAMWNNLTLTVKKCKNEIRYYVARAYMCHNYPKSEKRVIFPEAHRTKMHSECGHSTGNLGYQKLNPERTS